MRTGLMKPEGQMPETHVETLEQGLFQVMWNFVEVTTGDDQPQQMWEYTFVNTSEKLEGVPRELWNAVWTQMGKSEQDIEVMLWHYPEWAKRIVAPIELILDDTGIKMYGWFQLNSFPVEKVGDQVHLYCNVILPQHQAIVDELGEVVTVEDRPEILT